MKDDIIVKLIKQKKSCDNPECNNDAILMIKTDQHKKFACEDCYQKLFEISPLFKFIYGHLKDCYKTLHCSAKAGIIKLKPCKCGYHRIKIVYEGGDNGVELKFYALCKKCFNTGPDCDTDEQAREAWNKQ